MSAWQADHPAVTRGPDNPVLAWLANLLTPISRRQFRPEMNRATEATVAQARLDVLEIRREAIWREMLCRPSSAAGPRPT